MQTHRSTKITIFANTLSVYILCTYTAYSNKKIQYTIYNTIIRLRNEQKFKQFRVSQSIKDFFVGKCVYELKW